MIFVSKKYKGLRVVLDAKSYQVLEGKRMVRGLMGKFPNGKVAEFVDHKYETEDKDVIAALKADSNYGLDFYALESDEKTGMTKEPKLSDQAMRKLNEKKALAKEASETDQD